MNPLSRLNAKRNTTKLLNICFELIEKYEKENNSLCPSCKNDMAKLLKKSCESSKNEIAEWKDWNTDYIKIAHTMLVNGAATLLTSGQYHLYAGVLNPLGCAPNLMTVYEKAMEYGVIHNIITQEHREEQLKYLHEHIASL